MPYIYINKKQDKHITYGSLPIMCKLNDLDLNEMEKHFNRKKNDRFKDEDVFIVKSEFVRGGKK